MGHVDVTMPRLSDSMEEATVLRWLKSPGDSVAKGEPLVEVETDKATIVYEAELAGVLDEIVVAEEQTAALGAVLARLRIEGEAPPSPPGGPVRAPANGAPSQESAPVTSALSRGTRKRFRATPVARRLAVELGVSLEGVAGSGPGGRIVRRDVRAVAPAAPASGGTADGPAHVDVDLTATQRTIARRMAQSRAEIPEFTLEVEIDMERLSAVRDDLRARFDPPPSLNDFVVKAVALALREFPGMNASYVDGKVRRFAQVNVGIAVATDDALIVPVVRDADRRSVAELGVEARRLAEQARTRSLSVDAVEGGTFTVSNLGMFRIRRFNAVINHPQAAILAVGEVALRPVAVTATEIVGRLRMDVALSCDHRAVYGAEAARFLARVQELLEHPAVLLIG